GASGDCFGCSVSIDGDTCLIGAHWDDEKGLDSGAAYAFTRKKGTWSEQAKLVASDGASGDRFGYSVSIDGDTCLIGAHGDDDKGASSGSAYAFTRKKGTWSEQTKLVASDGASGDCLGYSVSIDGDTCVVGALGDDGKGSNAGSAYVWSANAIPAVDHSAGFVTGGGSIDSPAGAYAADPTLVGRATFGFVSKHKKGASVPEGSTEFQFKAGDLNFHSNTQQGLVVNEGGTNAQLKGSGTINGELAPNDEEYKFMIWAGDGETDTFRMKIWYEVDDVETAVYDNGVDQAIGGGSIVVHD
ncbi:MAG: FG-GAP repeat protein, partial [Coriobacteriia bacterium]|nr:FG-GAP repeat protein [Coriobacteriia bacterium]